MTIQTKIDYNSCVNQDIKGKLVQREVYTCFSYEMDAILKMSYESSNHDLPTFEDIENYYYDVCPHCHEDLPETDELKEGEQKEFICSSCQEEFNDSENEAHEIFEWWIVSSWLYENLKRRGYPVLEWGNNYYWGRCTTGQAILLDHVMSLIAEEMEILEGQRYSWAK